MQIAATKFTFMLRIIFLAAVNVGNVEHLIGLPQESNAAFFVGLSAAASLYVIFAFTRCP